MLRPESDKSHDESTEEKKILNELLEVGQLSHNIIIILSSL